MNRLTSVGLFDLWWLEATAEWGREYGTPRPFRLYLDAVMNVALMETIRKPPSRQKFRSMAEDTECIGTAEYFLALLTDDDEEPGDAPASSTPTGDC